MTFRARTHKSIDTINREQMNEFNFWKQEAYTAIAEIEDLFACTIETKEAALRLKKELIARFVKLPVAVDGVGFKVTKLKGGFTYNWHFKIKVNQMGMIRRKDDPADVLFITVPDISENPLNEGYLYSTDITGGTIKDALMIQIPVHEMEWRI